MTGGRAALRALVETYLGRVIITFAMTLPLLLLIFMVLDLPVTLSTVASVVFVSIAMVSRTGADLHTAHRLLAGLTGLVVLPLAVLVDTIDMWTSVGFGTALWAVGAYACRHQRLRRTRPPRDLGSVWLELPDGRELPLETRPCDTCSLVHWHAFAIGEPIRLIDPPVGLRVERRPRKRLLRGPVEITAPVVEDEWGWHWIPTAPAQADLPSRSDGDTTPGMS